MTTTWTRRQFLRRALVGGVGVGLSGLFLSACGSGSSSPIAAAASETSGAPATGATTATTQSTAASASPTDMSGMNMTTTEVATPASTSQVTPAPSATEAASAVSSGSAPAPVAIKIVEPSLDYQTWTYNPDKVKVPVGTTVTWTNTGGAAHTVTADDGKAFDSGPIQPDKTYTRKMDTAGTFPYHCTFHPFMKGTITVTA